MRIRFKVILLLLVFLFGCASEKPRFSALLKTIKNLPPAQKEEKLIRFSHLHYFPFLEDSVAYFLYQDTSGTDVFLAGDFTDWKPDSVKMERIARTTFVFKKLKFPYNARLEYKFVVNGKWLLDPLNPLQEQGGLGVNSVLAMPGYEFSNYVLLRPEFRTSRLDTFWYKSKVLKNRRRVYLYRNRKSNLNSPLLIFNDGSDYLRFAKARIILDNMIGTDSLMAINALFVDPVNRNREYWLNEKYLRMVFQELLPYVKKQYGLKPERLGFGGCSLGGVTALFALKDYSNQLDFVFSQSGALWIENQKILSILQNSDLSSSKIYLSYGQFEKMENTHKKLESLLRTQKAKFKLQKFAEGHNWGNWRGHLDQALNYFEEE